MSRRGAAALLAALALSVLSGCAERPSRIERDNWTLFHKGGVVGTMSLECMYYSEIALCTQVVDIGEPGASEDQLQRTAVLSRQHPRTRFLQFAQHEIGVASSYERERKRHHPTRAVLEIDALALAASSGRVWWSLPVLHPRTGDEVPMRCVVAPAPGGAARLWCMGQSGSVLAEVGGALRVDWIRNAGGVEALRHTATHPCDDACRAAAVGPAADVGPATERGIEPSTWRAAARITGPISGSARLDVPGRQRALVAPDRSSAVVYVIAEPAVPASSGCLNNERIGRVVAHVGATQAGRRPAPTGGLGADCTEDADAAVALLRGEGCEARAVVGYARGGGLDGWHAWVEVVEASGIRTLDPRSGASPVPAGWIRTGLRGEQRTVDADSDVLQMRFTYLEPDAALADIEAAGNGSGALTVTP